MKALVLCAGFGTRFRPATLTTPKPLLPFLGEPILHRLARHLAAEGVTSLVLNAHHLAGVLVEAVGSSYAGLPVTVSVEEEILGTTGAIRCAAERGLLDGSDPFLVANGDLYTTLPLGSLQPPLEDPAVLSSLLVLPNSIPDEATPLWADARGRLVGVGRERPADAASGPWLFTGLQLVRRALLSRIPSGYSELARDLLVPSARERDGAFALVPLATPEDGFWFDLGTPVRLAAAEAAVTARGGSVIGR